MQNPPICDKIKYVLRFLEVVKMQISKILKNLWFFTASFFTAISTVICLAILVMSESEVISAGLLDPSSLLLILLLSFLMAVGSTLYRLDGINKALAVCLHAVIYNSGFFAFLWLNIDYKDGDNSRLATAVIGTLILAVVYVVTMISIRMITKAVSSPKKKVPNAKSKPSEAQSTSKKAKKEEKEPYKNLFS